MSSVRLPLVASVLGHAGVLALLVLFAAQLPPMPLPQPQKSGIEVMLMPPQPVTETPPTAPEPPPVATEPPPPEPPPPPAVIPKPEPPPPPAVIPKPEPPPPPSKPVVHKRVVKPPPPRPQPHMAREVAREPVPMPRAMPQTAPVQTAAIPTIPAPAPRPAPVVSPGYRSMLSAWIEAHKRYPESARERGEEGRAVLRFRVDRSGRVLNYVIASSTGYADLDAAIDAMMRGAILPPFPADMTTSDVEVSVPLRFSLTR